MPLLHESSYPAVFKQWLISEPRYLWVSDMGLGVNAGKLLERKRGSKGKAISNWMAVLCRKLRRNVFLSDSESGPEIKRNTNMK